MKKGILSILAASVVTAMILAPSAQAQATRTWVSGVGDDVNPCSRTAPCKTYAGAISKTAAGGEISTLDPGGFGGVTITKSLTINGDATIAGILASLTTGVTINGAATDKIHLRNLAINGATNGVTGIRIINAGQVVVENCWISGFTTRAVSVEFADAVGLALRSITLRNVLIFNNAAGVRVSNSSADDFTRVTVENSSIVSSTGIGYEGFSGNNRTLIKNSIISHNITDGVKCTNAACEINIEDSGLASNNGAAVNAAIASARIRLSNNTITNNGTSILITAGAFVDSTGNNKVAGNGGGVAPNGVYTQQ